MNYPPFDDARSKFLGFLVFCGEATDVVWLARGDVAVVARKLFIKVPPGNDKVPVDPTPEVEAWFREPIKG